MTFRDGLARLLSLLNETTGTTSEWLGPIQPQKPITIDHRSSLNIINNVTSYIPCFTITFPNTNPGEDSLSSNTTSATTTTINGNPLFRLIIGNQKLIPRVRVSAITFRSPIIPLPFKFIPISPNQNPFSRNHPILPLTLILIPIPPNIPPLSILQIPLPQALIIIPINIPLFTITMLLVCNPRTLISIPIGTSKGPMTLHSCRLKLALISRARRPRELAFPIGLALLPLTLVHAPIRPQVLATTMRNIP
uniref:Uncharacterized protein n=1 Tax=Opuntia streptacantha TaxID=393608 RepID=A0A7C9F0P8_OPUST